MTILTQYTIITVPKFTFQLELQGQVLSNLYIPMQTDQKHSVCKPPESAEKCYFRVIVACG